MLLCTGEVFGFLAIIISGMVPRIQCSTILLHIAAINFPAVWWACKVKPGTVFPTMQKGAVGDVQLTYLFDVALCFLFEYAYCRFIRHQLVTKYATSRVNLNLWAVASGKFPKAAFLPPKEWGEIEQLICDVYLCLPCFLVMWFRYKMNVRSTNGSQRKLCSILFP